MPVRLRDLRLTDARHSPAHWRCFARRTAREPDRGSPTRTINMPFPEPVKFGDGRFRSVIVIDA
jgi:hypothetical protein